MKIRANLNKELNVIEVMKLGSQQLKEEMSKLKSIGGGYKLNIGNVEQENYDEGKEGWAKFLNFISTKAENTQFNNHLKVNHFHFAHKLDMSIF